MPVLNAFIKEYGKEQTVKLVDPVIRELAREGGVPARQGPWGKYYRPFWKGAFRMDSGRRPPTGCQRADGDEVCFNVTRCRYAEMYKELGVQEYGALLSCGRDAALIVGFNPKIKFTRTQTIMSGAPYCDFRYELMA